jgi:serine/threonine protein kinase
VSNRAIRARRFGQWVTTRKIGAGGNAIVWRVRGDDRRKGALKVIVQNQGDRLTRFRDEIEFLLRNPERAGVLPLIDSYLPTDKNDRPWFVMPEALPLKKALGIDPEPSLVVAALAEIAASLADLAADGIGHRDIKPDNLFMLNGKYVVGDFGLVIYPDKNPVTRHGRKVGPVDYMAPKMRRDADTAAPEPADVWALAKTLWVLLADVDLPLPGPHRAGDTAFALSGRIEFEWANEIDILLERATYINPEDRISMRGFARELDAALREPPENVGDASAAELSDRIVALTRATNEQEQERQAELVRVGALYESGHKLLDDIAAALAGYLPDFVIQTDDYSENIVNHQENIRVAGDQRDESSA